MRSRRSSARRAPLAAASASPPGPIPPPLHPTTASDPPAAALGGAEGELVCPPASFRARPPGAEGRFWEEVDPGFIHLGRPAVPPARAAVPTPPADVDAVAAADRTPC